MPEPSKLTRIETQAIVTAYAMSRLDSLYLNSRGLSTWKQAFVEASTALGEPPTSFKNLRDEFDPVHANSRRGWHQRDLRPNRQRVLNELCDVSDEALLELVARILNRDEAATVEAIDSLAVVTHTAHNVAERLLTGRRAEDYFLENCRQLVGVERNTIIDCRNWAGGFDFGVKGRSEWAIEIKGMKQTAGSIQFTDREWSEAALRLDYYWLIIIGNLASKPIPRIVQNPHAVLTAHCSYQTSIAAVWRSSVRV